MSTREARVKGGTFINIHRFGLMIRPFYTSARRSARTSARASARATSARASARTSARATSARASARTSARCPSGPPYEAKVVRGTAFVLNGDHESLMVVLTVPTIKCPGSLYSWSFSSFDGTTATSEFPY